MRHQARASSMVEIIIAIGVLAVVSMFVLQLFVKASNIEHKAHDLDIACMKAQTFLEECKSSGEYADETHFDSEWKQVEAKDAKGYTIVMSVEEQEGMHHITIEVRKNSPYMLESDTPEVYELKGSARLGKVSI